LFPAASALPFLSQSTAILIFRRFIIKIFDYHGKNTHAIQNEILPTAHRFTAAFDDGIAWIIL